MNFFSYIYIARDLVPNSNNKLEWDMKVVRKYILYKWDANCGQSTYVCSSSIGPWQMLQMCSTHQLLTKGNQIQYLIRGGTCLFESIRNSYTLAMWIKSLFSSNIIGRIYIYCILLHNIPDHQNFMACTSYA